MADATLKHAFTVEITVADGHRTKGRMAVDELMTPLADDAIAGNADLKCLRHSTFFAGG